MIRPGDACSADGFTGALDLSFGTGGTVLLRTDEALTRVGSFTDPGLSLDLFC